MKNKVILFLLVGAVAASAAYLLLLGVVEEIDLDRVSEPYSLPLEDGSGRNTLWVERGRICVSEADCPDQICVNQGWISNGAVPIICLPHRLMIEIVDGGGGLDGAAG